MRSILGFLATMMLVSGTSVAKVDVGQVAPNFTLHDVNGKTVHLSDFRGKTIVLEWINEGCPFSRGHYESGNMQSLQQKYTGKGVVWLTINSTRPDNPEAYDADKSKEILSKWGSKATDNLMDTARTVGHLYDAKTTPHMFVIDSKGVIRYEGAIDDHRGTDGGKGATVNYVSAALDAILSGKNVTVTKTTPYGCSVKY